MAEITDFQYEIVDPDECLNTSSLFGFARENDYLIARCTFRSDGEKAIALCLISRELALDGDMDLETYFMFQVQGWADTNEIS